MAGPSLAARKDPCGFDTHYPEYFPVRPGFGDAVAHLQGALGVRVAPYINGRIFDKRSEKWAGDGARAHAAKQLASPALIANASDPAFLAALRTYDEEYGSHAPFAVMCPHTAYWQARHGSAEDFCRLKAPCCTAMDWIFIPAHCFALP